MGYKIVPRWSLEVAMRTDVFDFGIASLVSAVHMFLQLALGIGPEFAKFTGESSAMMSVEMSLELLLRIHRIAANAALESRLVLVQLFVALHQTLSRCSEETRTARVFRRAVARSIHQFVAAVPLDVVLLQQLRIRRFETANQTAILFIFRLFGRRRWRRIRRRVNPAKVLNHLLGAVRPVMARRTLVESTSVQPARFDV